jgi:hypothetical protein
MLHFGRNAASDPSKIVKSAQFVQEEVKGVFVCCVIERERVRSLSHPPRIDRCSVAAAAAAAAAAQTRTRTHTRTQLPKRLARRLLDLQLLP